MISRWFVLISGAIASGKTTLAKALSQRLNERVMKTRDIAAQLASSSSLGSDRKALQDAGSRLDGESPAWVANNAEHTGSRIIDAVRTVEQVDVFRARYARVFHVHLKADNRTLEERFEARGKDGPWTYSGAVNHEAERRGDQLEHTADLVVDTSRCTPEDVALQVMQQLYRTPHERTVDVIVGGQYGSEGKGHIVAYIAPEYDVLVRVGGPNAGHTVLDPETGEKVSFYHLPSGALHAPDALLVLGPGAVINPTVLLKEAKHLHGLEALVGRLFIDPQANVISEADMKDETELVKGIGSTGQGVGVATARKILDRGTEHRLARDCPMLTPFIRPTLDVLETAYREQDRILLEGTQGTGLSLHHGHYPFVTSRDTTVSGTAGEAGIPPSRINRSIVVLRTFPIRVQSPAGGSSGPMGIELSWEEIAKTACVDSEILRQLEMTTTTKRQRRVAAFNWADLRRAVMLNGPTDLALTFTDYIHPSNAGARRYEQLTEQTREFVDAVEAFSSTPVSLINTRVHQRSVIDRRTWRER